MVPQWLADILVKLFGASFATKVPAIIALLALGYRVTGTFLDGDPNTNTDWNQFSVEFGVIWAVLFARANKVSSEAAGAKK